MRYQAIQIGMGRVLGRFATDPAEFQPRNYKGAMGPVVACSVDGSVGLPYSECGIFSQTNGKLIYEPATFDPGTEKVLGEEMATANGVTTISQTIALKSAEEIEAEQTSGLVAAVSGHLDSVAQSRNYTNISTACEYAGEVNIFQAESKAYIAWRAACWEYCYQVLADVKASLRTTPTGAELVAELPLPSLPPSPVGL